MQEPHEPNVLIVTAYVDIAEADKSEWVARAIAEPPSPLAGLFAFGPSFHEARKALAGVVWAAVVGGATGLDAGQFAAVRVMSVTRKTFAVGDLGPVGA
jgi:hypothetical protein